MRSLLQIMLQIMIVFALIGTDAISDSAFGDVTFGDATLSNADSSYNRSTILLSETRNISQSPVIMKIGSGYYSSRPISYTSLIGSETWIKDTSAAASMNHEVSYAQGINGERELSAKGGSYYQDDYYQDGYLQDDYHTQNTSSIQMKIDEEVTEGMVHIGVLQGSSDSSSGAGAGGSSDKMTDAWKNPSLEMEENYIGTYHIKKNMTITTGQNYAQRSDYWLDCCGGGYFNTEYYPIRLINADEVFNYRFVNA